MTAAMSPQLVNPSLVVLPDELLLHILTYLDIPELLSLSRTTTHFRALSHDPLLHASRLFRASITLEHSITTRRSLADLMAHRIYITRTTLAARTLGRNLIKIKLNRQLSNRPSPERLVDLGVLPMECYTKGAGGFLAPSLIEVKRRVEKERVKDVLRGWIDEWRRRGGERDEAPEQKTDVRRMARRFAREREGRERDLPRWGKAVERKEDPARAKVLGLRKFWEKVGRDGAGSP